MAPDAFERLDDVFGAAKRHHQTLEHLLLRHLAARGVSTDFRLEVLVFTLELIESLHELILFG